MTAPLRCPLADPGNASFAIVEQPFEPAALAEANRRGEAHADGPLGAQTRGRLNRGPRAGVTIIPAAIVVACSMLAILPMVSIAAAGPDFGFLMLLAWRLLRADAWPAWWAAPLGFVNDLMTGMPIGLSVTMWTAVMLVMDLVDRRTHVARLLDRMGGGRRTHCRRRGGSNGASRRLIGAPVPFTLMLPADRHLDPGFPLVAYLASRLDRWRLGR